MQARTGAALVVLGVLALAASGCGDTVSLDPVAKAADATSKQASEHMTMTATATTGGQQSLTMVGEGDFRNAGNVGALAMRVTEGPAVGSTVQTVMNGSKIYLTSNVLRSQLPNGKTWMSLDVAKEARVLGLNLGSSFTSQSPATTLAQLRAAGSVKLVGPETVAGVATTHYSAMLDPSRAAKVSKALGTTVTYAPVEVWVDRHGLVRRMHFAYVQQASTLLPEASMEMTMTLSRYGEPVHVAVPPSWLTYDATDAALSILKK